MLERTSAIASGLAAGGRLRDGAAGVRLGEVRGWSLLQVAGFADGMAGVEQAVGSACGFAVPARIGLATHSGDLPSPHTLPLSPMGRGDDMIDGAVPSSLLPDGDKDRMRARQKPDASSLGLTVFRTGPEQLWIVGLGERLAIEAGIRAAIGHGAGVVTSLSHSRTRMFIEGARARDVLAKEIAVDLDPGVFAVDQFALTGFDHTPVLLHRTGAERYEIYAMRTFALTVWDRLADGALEFGYEVGAVTNHTHETQSPSPGTAIRRVQ